MFVHHVATISLLSFSYIINFLRVGTLVLCIHDSVDFWIEVSLPLHYQGFPSLNLCFIVSFLVQLHEVQRAIVVSTVIGVSVLWLSVPFTLC